ncbi:hypothetical protein [Aureimonas sp. AU4]|uniref:hypothetical protein n=1 Tax=Aureimonas sp. AU4 TaxID=1638163 RepID=UPI0007841F45|nr:hypothetical protein [Aureimonas sp. AU4]
MLRAGLATREDPTMQIAYLTYCVKPIEDGHWTVECCSMRNGRFASRLEALRCAVLDADRVQRMGHRVLVVIHRPFATGYLCKRVLRRSLPSDHAPLAAAAAVGSMPYTAPGHLKAA